MSRKFTYMWISLDIFSVYRWLNLSWKIFCCSLLVNSYQISLISLLKIVRKCQNPLSFSVEFFSLPTQASPPPTPTRSRFGRGAMERASTAGKKTAQETCKLALPDAGIKIDRLRRESGGGETHSYEPAFMNWTCTVCVRQVLGCVPEGDGACTVCVRQVLGCVLEGDGASQRISSN